MKNVASCSFGKDSLAAIIVSEEHGVHIDEAIYCRIMFDDQISAELPEHEEFIHEVAIPTLEKRYGIKTTIVQGSYSYKDYFYKQYEKGGKIGKIWGFPFLRGPWCNTRLKTRPLKKYTKTIGTYTEVVGIAADEKKRIGRKTVQGKFLPLVEYGVTEKQAFEICKRGGCCPLLTAEEERGLGAGFVTISGFQSCGGCGKNTRNYGWNCWNWIKKALAHSNQKKPFTTSKSGFQKKNCNYRFSISRRKGWSTWERLTGNARIAGRIWTRANLAIARIRSGTRARRRSRKSHYRECA